MAAWRRKALELFPQLRVELGRGDFNVYLLFFQLLPMAKRAHKANDQETLARIYGFAHWCLLQRRSQEPGNAVAVAFYEHLFDDWSLRDQVIAWLSPDIVQEIWPLWEWYLDAAKVEELRKQFPSLNQ